jgi:hypothetical protein
MRFATVMIDSCDTDLMFDVSHGSSHHPSYAVIETRVALRFRRRQMTDIEHAGRTAGVRDTRLGLGERDGEVRVLIDVRRGVALARRTLHPRDARSELTHVHRTARAAVASVIDDECLHECICAAAEATADTISEA